MLSFGNFYYFFMLSFWYLKKEKKMKKKKNWLRPSVRRPPIPRGHMIKPHRREKERKGAWKKELKNLDI